MPGPDFFHTCQACVFLGHYEERDLYYCPQHHTFTVRSKFDSLEVSAELATNPYLKEACVRAERRGLLFASRTEYLLVGEQFGDEED